MVCILACFTLKLFCLGADGRDTMVLDSDCRVKYWTEGAYFIRLNELEDYNN